MAQRSGPFSIAHPLALLAVTLGVLGLAAPAAFAAPPLPGTIAIARGGVAAARIVVAPDEPPTVRHAADELALHLRIVTGSAIPVDDRPGEPGGRLLVGPAAARWSDPGFDAAALAPEEIVVRSSASGDLVLCGGSPRGTLYAVYEFLESAVGCRWWTSTASRMPWRPDLDVPQLDIRYNPPLEYREPFWYVAFDPVWAARNKANGIQAGGDPLRGGRQVYEGFVHTFYRLIPPETYFAAHPEWFSEVGGRRRPENAQLCLTNEEMRAELVRNLRAALRRNPAATIASVSQNDCKGACECPKCRAVDEEEGSPAGAMLRFVNAVAADLQAEFPNVAFDTLAYQYTRKPPRLTKPRSNVIVRLCSIECSFSRPLDDPRNKAFFEDLKAWSAIAGRLYIWDYVTNFSHYVQPHPNISVLAANIRLFTRHNVRGVFEQGAYQSWGSEMAELRAWMLAQLLWDPSRDPKALRREFVEGYYGPASGDISAYLEMMDRAVRKSGDALGCYSPAYAKFLSIGNLAKAWDRLEKAAKRVDGTVEYASRVRRARLPLAYVVVTRWDSLRTDAIKDAVRWRWGRSRDRLLAWFLAAAREEKITKISEWQTLDEWAAKAGGAK